MVLNKRNVTDHVITNSIIGSVIIGVYAIGAGINWAVKIFEKNKNKNKDPMKRKNKKGDILYTTITQPNGKIFIQKKIFMKYDENGNQVWKDCGLTPV
jgi:hypothetical protein